MNIDNHYYQSNRQIAFTHIIYLAHNYFCNCHQLPLWRITRDYSCPIETLISNPPSALPDVNLKNTNQKNHDPQLGLLHSTINLVILNLSRSNVLKTPPPDRCLRTRTTHNEDSASHLIDFVPKSHCPTCNTKAKSFTCNCCGDEVGKNLKDKNEFFSAKAPHPSHSNSIQIRAHQIPYPRTIMTATSLSSKTYSKITKGHRIFLPLFLRQLKRRAILEPASRNSRDTQNCRRHRNLQGRGQCKHTRPVSHKNSTGQSDRTLPRMLTTIPRRGQLHRAFETTCGTREMPRLLFRLEHYDLIFQASQVTENPKNFRTRNIYDSNLVHLAPPKHGTSILNG